MPNIGLVLSGGMAKGAYQLGALQAINTVFKPSVISYVSSASIGALNSYLYLTNNLDKGVELWSSVSSENSRTWVTTLLKSSFLQNAIKSILSKEEITNVFYVPLVNLRKRKLSYIDFGKVSPENIESYLHASVAMPIYNSAVQINEDYYYDGALIDNIPIHPVLKHSIDYIICIYFDSFNYTFESTYLDNKVIKMNFTDNRIISNSIIFKGESIKYMLDEGYLRAKRILDYVFINGIEDVDSIYSRIIDLNTMTTSKNLRITGDVVVNNMNRITKKFMKRLEIL
ncbi:MAG: patatin-like phospholipase family protein [Oscillospiraceae bacterium]|jgi:predicted acylesterase/phospholipase RssA|nr:patatin-like phospholipase family protein [Oscillospiraceae bacterium]